MNSFELAKSESREAIRKALQRFKDHPTAANLSAVIATFNARPKDRRAGPRVQGWRVVAD